MIPGFFFCALAICVASVRLASISVPPSLRPVFIANAFVAQFTTVRDDHSEHIRTNDGRPRITQSLQSSPTIAICIPVFDRSHSSLPAQSISAGDPF